MARLDQVRNDNHDPGGLFCVSLSCPAVGSDTRKEGIPQMSGNADEIASDEKVVEIELERLHPFRGHPFKVRDDPQMLNLIDSISKYGVLNPLIVRPVPEGWYEIISGHRRKYAAQKLGYRKLPVIIRVLKDDEAVISMIDSNLHREVLLPSEKAFALKMKYDAIKRRSGRRKSGQVDHEKDRKKTVEIMGEEAGESSKQIQRYLKVTELIPDLLDMLDAGKISFNPAYEAAFLKKEEQEDLLLAMHFTKASPSLSQAQRMKKLSQEGKLNLEEMKSILGEIKKGEVRRVMFKNEQLYQFFPRSYTLKQIKEEILQILQERTEQSLQASNTTGKKSTQENTCTEEVRSTSSQAESHLEAKAKQNHSGTGSDERVRTAKHVRKTGLSSKVTYGNHPSGKSYIVTGKKIARGTG